MAPLGVHPPDPNSPKGMAFVVGAGFVDPRPGGYPNQPMALIQAWEPMSELWWALGLRYHPELATKWLTGGGQFACATVVDKKPEDAASLKDAAEEVLEDFREKQPEFVAEIERLRDSGTEAERASALKLLELNVKNTVALASYLKGGNDS